jgi:glycosyltransferase involved in cell wall biosynthesis
VKLLVQIPCLDEENDIRSVIASIPKKIDGVDSIDVLVIDDGSTDNTVDIAIQAGADFVIKKHRRKGLAHSFKLGQLYFLTRDYDILVNTDGDNQYFQERIPELIQPLLHGEADVVIGDRETGSLSHFSIIKRLLQRIGSLVVSYVAGAKIPDAASGFRAYSRLAVSKLFITKRFSYAMESIIQAGNKGLRLVSIPAGAREVSRPSRLFTSTFQHVRLSGVAILKSALMYRPAQIFTWFSLLLFISGLVPMVRYLVLVYSGVAGDHIQSLILGSLLITTSIMSLVLGLVAELSRIHRELFEEERSIERLSSPPSLEAVLTSYSAELFFARKKRPAVIKPRK